MQYVCGHYQDVLTFSKDKVKLNIDFMHIEHMKKHFIILIILALAVGVLGGYYFRDCQYKKEMETERVGDYIDSLNLDQQNSQNDPLGLFDGSNPAIEECLDKVNPSDPLGLSDETETQKLQREACMNTYYKK